MKLKKIILLTAMMALPSVGLSAITDEQINKLAEIQNYTACKLINKPNPDTLKSHNDVIYMKVTSMYDKSIISYIVYGDVKLIIHSQGENIKNCSAESQVKIETVKHYPTFCNITTSIPAAVINDDYKIINSKMDFFLKNEHLILYRHLIVSSKKMDEDLASKLKPYYVKDNYPHYRACFSNEILNAPDTK